MKKTKALISRLLEELEKTPIIQVACDKIGISRNTFYRWIKEDPTLLTRVNYAISLGTGRVNDVAISNVLSGIQKKDVRYTMYWLNRKHPDFRQPYVYKVDADDLLSHTRAVAEGAKRFQLEQEMKNASKTLDAETIKQKTEKVRSIFRRWKKVMAQQEEKKAKELFEQYKKEYENKKKKSSEIN
jgi:hypothetical protein